MFRRIIKILFFILVIPGAIITLFFAEGAKINNFWQSQDERMRENYFHLVQTYHLLGLHDDKNSYISEEALIDYNFVSDDELESISIHAYPFTLFDKKGEYDAFTIFISDLKINDLNAQKQDDLYYLFVEYHFNKKIHKDGVEYAYFEDRPVMISENKDTYFLFAYLPDFRDSEGNFVEIEKIIVKYGIDDKNTKRFLTLSDAPASDYKDSFSNELDRSIRDFNVENISLSEKISLENAINNENIYFDQNLEGQKKRYRHYPYTYMAVYLIIAASIAYFIFFHKEFVKTIKYKQSQKTIEKDKLKDKFREEYIDKGEKQ